MIPNAPGNKCLLLCENKNTAAQAADKINSSAVKNESNAELGIIFVVG